MASWRLVSTRMASVAVVISCATLLALTLQRELSSRERSPDPPIQHLGELLSIEGASTMGNRDASVVLVVFTDYQCPFCARFALNVLPRIVANYVNDGKTMVAVMNSPNPRIHPFAVGAAETAECAGQEGHFWQMQDLLFRNQASLSLARIDALWAAAGLDSGRLTACRRGGQMRVKVSGQSDVARKFDLTGTPTIAVGRKAASFGRVLVTQRFDGVPQDPVLTASIDKALGQANK
jgi:protein-disulfide isomerase